LSNHIRHDLEKSGPLMTQAIFWSYWYGVLTLPSDIFQIFGQANQFGATLFNVFLVLSYRYGCFPLPILQSQFAPYGLVPHTQTATKLAYIAGGAIFVTSFYFGYPGNCLAASSAMATLPTWNAITYALFLVCAFVYIAL